MLEAKGTGVLCVVSSSLRRVMVWVLVWVMDFVLLISDMMGSLESNIDEGVSKLMSLEREKPCMVVLGTGIGDVRVEGFALWIALFG